MAPARTDSAPVAPELTDEDGRKAWTKSGALRWAKAIMGPFARIWVKDGVYILGLERDGKRVETANGATPYDLIKNAFVEPIRIRAELAKTEGEKNPRVGETAANEVGDVTKEVGETPG